MQHCYICMFQFCTFANDVHFMINEQILLGAGIPVTAQRLLLLDFFISARKPVSKKEISAHFENSLDRVTLYRILNKFIQCGIVRKLSNDLGGLYALAPAESEATPHLHFLCDKCHQTYCMREITLNEIKLPEGFLMNNIEYLAHGICASCNA